MSKRRQLREPTRTPCPLCGGLGGVLPPAIEGAQWRKCRIAAGWSLHDLASLTGFSASYVCDLEHGRRPWKESLRERFRSVLPATTDRP